jgi:hypothetical protein
MNDAKVQASRSQLWLTLGLLAACLPDDSRPPASRVTLSIRGGENVTQSFASSDGWEIAIERLLVSFGQVELFGRVCAQYSETTYLRLLDLTRPEPQLVATQYGRGDCGVSFGALRPGPDVVLGAGVTELERAEMRGRGLDDASALHVEGNATSATGSVRFVWSLRDGWLWGPCQPMQLDGAASHDLTLDVEPEALFSADMGRVGSELRFGPFAAADADENGEVTAEELALTPVTSVPSAANELDRLQGFLVPKLFRLQTDAECLGGRGSVTEDSIL